MSDVCLAAVAAVVVFGGLTFLLVQFNQSQIRHDVRTRHRRTAERELSDVVARWDVIEGRRGGVPIRIEGGWKEGTPVYEVPLTTSASLIGGSITPFRFEAATSEAGTHRQLAREGLASETLARHAARLGGGSVVCDGSTVWARTTKSYALPDAIHLIAEIARAPERALRRIAEVVDADATKLDECVLRLGSESRPVTITIDGGVRLAIDAAPLDGLMSARVLQGAIASMRSHARGPELDALATDLTGTLEVSEDRVVLTVPFATPPEHVLRAVELLDRLTETERGPFR